MTPIEFDPQEGEVAQLAVQALTAANRRAIQLGRSVIVVENDELVRIGSPFGKTVLKKLPPRRKVVFRIKRAST
jgi:hypothetical protein